MKDVEKNLQAEQMTQLIQSISAYIEQYHGGSAELISFEDNVALILRISCVICSARRFFSTSFIFSLLRFICDSIPD